MDDEKKTRLEIAKNIFEEVLKANLHQSEKAARLLIPIAFLTGAATFLFNFFLENNISATWKGINFIPVLFLVYLFCTIGGTISIIETIGPSFEIKGWPRDGREKGEKGEKGEKRSEGPESLLFFKFILKKEANEWMNIFLKEETRKLEGYLETDKLRDKLIHDYVVESYQLAKKTHGKVKKNLAAHLLFYVSFCSLLLMAYSGIVSYLNLWNWTAKFLIILILAVFGYLSLEIGRKYFR